jgi:hypothetical protein
MENKGNIPVKSCSRERVRLYFSFTTRNCGASKNTRAKKPNASMAKVMSSRVV